MPSQREVRKLWMKKHGNRPVYTADELARMLGISKSNFIYLRKKYALPKRKQGSWPLESVPEKVKEFAKLRQEGRTYASIGKKFKCTRQNVHLALKRWDLL